jgi:hypothetical protein
MLQRLERERTIHVIHFADLPPLIQARWPDIEVPTEDCDTVPNIPIVP